MFMGKASKIVNRLNQPGKFNALGSRAIRGMLDGPAALRRASIGLAMAGGAIDEKSLDDRGWVKANLVKRASLTYHPAGTCRMGAETDQLSVVNSRCEVQGVAGLSVADASIMPTIVRANLNLPVTMIAERASDLLMSGG